MRQLPWRGLCGYANYIEWACIRSKEELSSSLWYFPDDTQRGILLNRTEPKANSVSLGNRPDLGCQKELSSLFHWLLVSFFVARRNKKKERKAKKRTKRKKKITKILQTRKQEWRIFAIKKRKKEWKTKMGIIRLRPLHLQPDASSCAFPC